MNRGIFTISIDLELAWGECDKPIQPATLRAIELEREVIKWILGLFSKYNISATWAIVGHLLVADSKNANGPLWYGRDIIENIKDTFPKQEIGSHSFCHILYDEERVSSDLVKSDIEKAKKIHQDSNLPFEIFIFPSNIVGYRELLAKAGIRSYRGKSRCWYDSIPCHTIRRLLNFLSFLISATPQTVTAAIDEMGMVNIPQSMFILDNVGIRRIVPPNNLIRMGIAGLNRAIKRKEIFHLWFHPFSFTYKSNRHLYALEVILKHAQHLMDNGQLEILTMGQIQKIVVEAEGFIPRMSVVEKIREKAIEFHNKSVIYFDENYKSMSKDYFATLFGYGRKKLEILLDETLHNLPRGSKVLDIGCGTGEHIKRYYQFEFDITGIEPSLEMRKIAQSRNPAVSIIDGLITILPFQDESFDFVMAIEVLRYLHRMDILKAYQEMLRVVKPGGWIFFTMANLFELDGFYIYDTVRRFLFAILRCKEPVHCEFVTPWLILRDLNKLGIREVSFHGRLFAPLCIAYKINSKLGIRIAKFLDPIVDPLSRQKWMAAFDGHLVVIARRPLHP